MLSKPKLANILLYRFDIDEWKEQKKKKKDKIKISKFYNYI